MVKMDSQTTDEPNNKSQADKLWNWHPDLPISISSIFVFPPNLYSIAKSLASTWLVLSGRVVILIASIVSWLFFHPTLEQCVDFKSGWIFEIYARNLIIMMLFAGGLHLYFYTFKMQGNILRFDSKDQVRANSVFTFQNQVRDNIFWSLASGLTIWTVYEVLFMWAFANNLIPTLNWDSNQVWYVALFVLIPIWYSLHFYFTHRAEHWKPIYKLVHALHHRNINIGPWSGSSMHPIEHIFYIASPAIHLIVPSSPLHVIYHFQFTILAGIISHTGYEALLIKGKRVIELGYFFHQLHHRFFDCNYGTGDMPWDKWFSTFHNGTTEATQALRKKQAAQRLKKKQYLVAD